MSLHLNKVLPYKFFEPKLKIPEPVNNPEREEKKEESETKEENKDDIKAKRQQEFIDIANDLVSYSPY